MLGAIGRLSGLRAVSIEVGATAGRVGFTLALAILGFWCANDTVQLLVASLQDRVGAPIWQKKVVAELRADGDGAS